MHIFVIAILTIYVHVFASACDERLNNHSPNIALTASCVVEHDSGEYKFFHNAMRCCKCFIHCNCFGQCVGSYSVCFPEDTPRHPLASIDRAWHELMKGILSAKKAGPFFILDRYPLERLVNYEKERNIHSIADYLQIIEKFRSLISDARLDGIRSYNSLYSSPNEKTKLKENLKRVELEYKTANQILDEIPSQVIPLYQKAVMNCSHASAFSIYNKGLIHSLEGD